MNREFSDLAFDNLNHLQIGRIGEYWTKLWLTFKGFDIYTSEVDDKGIDFIVRNSSNYHIDVQVKTVRQNTKYVYVAKECWKDGLRENLYLALVLIRNGELPEVLFIPSVVWLTPNHIFKDKLYDKEGQTSKPEWGINLSNKNLDELRSYENF